MWALVVAGQILQTFQGQAPCISAATMRGLPYTACMQISQPPPQYAVCVPIGGGLMNCQPQ